MPVSDKHCILSCLDGHPEAFRLLVERYQAPLVRHLCASLGNRGKAEEVAQEAFVRAYFALSELRKQEAFYSWLFGIADRVAKEYHRTKKRSREVGWEQVDPVELVGKQESQPDTAVTEAVANLPDIYREVVLLRFYGGQSCEEIGLALDVPLGTVTKRLSRAYVLLREQLRTSVPSGENEVSQ